MLLRARRSRNLRLSSAPRPRADTGAPSSAAALVDHTGDSPETAVVVPTDAPNEGIDFQNNWIFDRYGRFRRAGGGIAHAGEGRRCAATKW